MRLTQLHCHLEYRDPNQISQLEVNVGRVDDLIASLGFKEKITDTECQRCVYRKLSIPYIVWI